MKRLIVAAWLSVLVAGAALAQPRGGSGGRPPGPPPQRGGGGGQGGGGQQGGGPTSRPSADQIFDHFDANHDGVLSRAEFKEFLAHRPPPPGQGGNRPTSRPAD